MEVALTQELEKLVAEQVASGKYPSAGEVVREALRDLLAKQHARETKLEALRHDLKVGLDDLEEGRYVDYAGSETGSLVSDISRRGRLRLGKPEELGS